ncbi:MAG: hypothetical protein QXF50_02325 [Sulfolobales archaeon]
MKVLLINPVEHSKWNESSKALYKRFLPDVHVYVVSLSRGPLTVETAEAYGEVATLVVERG